jgi:hypothetical protein
LHPQWYGALNGYDIALIRLSTPVPYPFNDWINTVCLPELNEVVANDQQCVTIGYGDTQGIYPQCLANICIWKIYANVCCQGFLEVRE